MKSLLFSFVFVLAFASNVFCQTDLTLELKELKVGNMLSWSVEDVPQGSNFHINRALPNAPFVLIGELPANGTAGKQSYRFLDVASGVLEAEYKITLITKDNVQHSEPVSLLRTTANNVMISTMSNTITSGFFQVEMYAFKDVTGHYQILQGEEVVVEEPLKFVTGLNPLEIDFTNLAVGRYRLVFLSQTADEKGSEIDEVLINRVHRESRQPVQAVSLKN